MDCPSHRLSVLVPPDEQREKKSRSGFAQTHTTLILKKSAQKVVAMLVFATHRNCVKGDLGALIDALN